ncbi:hypothetical protein FQR65_LT13021 [Abscondita terminalis]|nr:hypothetical protein FQR65_LT13021 [Abscondita terminalis]
MIAAGCLIPLRGSQEVISAASPTSIGDVYPSSSRLSEYTYCVSFLHKNSPEKFNFTDSSVFFICFHYFTDDFGKKIIYETAPGVKTNELSPSPSITSIGSIDDEAVEKAKSQRKRKNGWVKGKLKSSWHESLGKPKPTNDKS